MPASLENAGVNVNARQPPGACFTTVCRAQRGILCWPRQASRVYAASPLQYNDGDKQCMQCLGRGPGCSKGSGRLML